MRHEASVAVAEGRFILDPFGAVPDDASRIAGLGGIAPPAEPGYVFRTIPVASPAGRAALRLVLHDLATVEGAISVELSVVTDQPGTVPLRMTTIVRSFRELTAQGGTVSIVFEAHRGHRYAIAGYSHGDFAIGASAVTVDLLTDPEVVAAVAESVHASAVPADLSIEPVPIPRLRALELPDFRDPLSQPMTAEQCVHPDFRRWREALHLGDHVSREDAWAQAFPLQVFTRFGTLSPGARALGVNVRDQAVPAMLAQLGCTIFCVEHADPSTALDRDGVLSKLQRPAVCPPERFDEAVSCIGLDLRYPEMVRGDFAIAWVDSRTSVTRFEDAFWQALVRLNPGGLCVHIFTFDPTGDGDAATPGRERVERLAVNAISFGHDVVQLSFRIPAAERRQLPRRIPFGLIARRT